VRGESAVEFCLYIIQQNQSSNPNFSRPLPPCDNPFVPHRLQRMAMRRGGTGAGDGETTQSPAIGPVQKMVLLRAEKGQGVPVRHWRAGADRDRRSRRLRAKARSRTCQPPAGSLTPKGQGPWTQRNRSCTGKTTERGMEAGLTGCREAVITNCGTHPCPGRYRVSKRGIGRRAWSTHGAERPA
jgi:hypothetical protein